VKLIKPAVKILLNV